MFAPISSHTLHPPAFPLVLFVIRLLLGQSLFAQAPKELRALFEVAGQDSGALLGQYVKGIGDLNKDGYADVAVSAPGKLLTYVYFGSATMSQTPSRVFKGGGAIASGDFNADGWIDLTIEKWATDTVIIYWGAVVMDTIPDVILHGENRYDGFGRNIAQGDINGDGLSDLIVGAAGYPQGEAESAKGRMYIFAGGQSFQPIASQVITGDTGHVTLGYDFAVGDINNNGIDDIIAIGWNTIVPNSNYWFFYISVFLGEPALQLTRNYYIDSRFVVGGFKDHVACFDADGDGIDDILVNKIYIFKGGAQLDTVPTYYVPPPNNDTTNFGPYPWIDGGGDFNGDGFKDMLVSRTDQYFGGVAGVFVMLNRLNHPGQYVAFRIYSDYWWRSPLYGRPQNAGDVNGDGVDDIIIGSPFEFLYQEGFFGIYSGDTSLVTGVKQADNHPEEFRMEQNYPNPFNPETTIEYTLQKKERVTIKIFDSLGREVIRLLNNEEQLSGTHNVSWNGTDSKGNRVSSGIYFYQLMTAKGSNTKKAVYVK